MSLCVAWIRKVGKTEELVFASDSRLVKLKEGNVSFRYKDNRNHGVQKIMTIQSVEFIRRFLQHILPNNFYKIRYYGILASVHTNSLREQCLALIGKITFLSKLEGLSAMEVYWVITGKNTALCPCCKNGRMEIVHRIPIPDN